MTKSKLLFFLSSLLIINGCSVDNADDISENITDKDFISGTGHSPYILWQWMNGCVTKEGITYDLESYEKVGITNVQQFLVGGIEADVTDSSVAILGEKWNYLMRFSLDECQRLGMDFGTHNCPGWSSSGAPGMKVEDSMQKLIWARTDVIGEKAKGAFVAHAEVDPEWNYYEDVCLIALPTDKEVILKEDVNVILNGIDSNGRLIASLPKGNWTILRFGHTTTGKMNLTAPLSGQGLEVDKMNRAALDEFWSLYPQKLIELAGEHAGNTFKRLEIDSYEMGAQDWTPNMPEEFEMRRGYDLFSWLPVIAGFKVESVDISDRFMHDWQTTINDLFADNYYKYLEKLTHQVPGMEFLCEPYGTGHGKNFDDMAIRGIGDILMAEFWIKPSDWGWSTLFPVASNAHVNGKKLVAAEAFTGQPMYAFQTDLADLKITGDEAFCKGVNLFVLHASAHQPWPWVKPGMTMGWWGTQFGPSQTWWENGASEWIQYVSRCQQILQKGNFVADLLYFHPGGHDYPEIPSGYKGDICSGKELLSQFSVKNNKLSLTGGMSYSLLILPKELRVELDLARKIEDFVRSGAIVVGSGFVGTPGLSGQAVNNEVLEISERLFGFSESNNSLIQEVRNVGKGRIYANFLPEDVLSQEGITKDLEVSDDPNDIGWIHRNKEGEHYYFVSNQTSRETSTRISFKVHGLLPEIWDPVSGEILKVLDWENNEKRTIVNLNLTANQSCFIVFREKTNESSGAIKNISIDDNSRGVNDLIVQSGDKIQMRLNEIGTYKLTFKDNSVIEWNQKEYADTILLNEDWKINFPDNLGAPKSAHFEKLISWTDHEEWGIKHFSGTAHYSNQFKIKPSNKDSEHRVMLDLGEVENIASVSINGEKVAVLWSPPFNLDITNYCKPGENLIEVDVTNLWPNRIIGDKSEPEDCEWGPVRDFPYVKPVPLIGRNLQVVPDWVKNNRKRPSENRITFCTVDFFTKDTPLLPSGLIGPVKISVEKAVDITGYISQ